MTRKSFFETILTIVILLAVGLAIVFIPKFMTGKMMWVGLIGYFILGIAYLIWRLFRKS